MLGDRLADGARALAGDMTELRHRLHRRPEVGLDLPTTQATLLAELDGLGLEITTGSALTSVTAVLRSTALTEAKDRPTVLLRSDMDALPVPEASGVDFASQNEGAMHACGHDLHMAMLVGAARLLAAERDALKGDVVFMFQPGEEGYDGAGHMIAEGVLDAAGGRVDAAYGIHVLSGKHPLKSFTTRPGTLMAASDWLHVEVHGRGGHGSSPHLTRDPISAAAEIVSGIHAFVTRRVDIFDPAVVTVGSLHGGTRRNIIPDEATFDATVRTFGAATQELLRAELPVLCRAIGAAYGVEVVAEYHPEYPATVNNAAEHDFVAATVREVFGPDDYRLMPAPDAGSEDFSRVLAEVPGCFTMLGACVGGDPAAAPSNHSPRAAFSDEVLPLGALLHAELATRSLARSAG